MEHVIDKVCSCEYCTMIDCLWGDPLLNNWERNFIGDLSGYGWFADYTQKQKAKIREVFKRILRRRGIKKNDSH